MLQFRKAWLAGALALALPVGSTFAANETSGSDTGFALDTGQINRGFDQKNPTDSKSRSIPTAAEAAAAIQMQVSAQPALGTFGNTQPTPAPISGAATTGAATGNSASENGAAAPSGPSGPSGPIGAVGATMPAKFSKRNDTLDRLPVMAWPLPLNDEQRKSIYQAVMAERTPVAADAGKLVPASVLSPDQYFNDLHPLPASLSAIGVIKPLQYVKAKNKVLLVEPATRVVFDEIDG